MNNRVVIYNKQSRIILHYGKSIRPKKPLAEPHIVIYNDQNHNIGSSLCPDQPKTYHWLH